MTRRVAVAAILVLSTGCFSGYEEKPAADSLRVRRGTFVSEQLLSGELEAARGEYLNVPPMPSWQTAIKWIVEDGAFVKAGQPVVELDNSALTTELESKKQLATQQLQQLQQSEAEWAAALEQQQLEVDKVRAQVAKAELDAGVPRELLAARKYEENQLALTRAQVALEKALDVLSAKRVSVESDRRNLMLQIEKANREISTAQNAIEAIVLRAPRDGVVVVRDHPWEGRKLQTGDTVWVGMPVAMLPDLTSLRVTASLPDVDDGRISVGMPATVTLDGYPSLPMTGRISAISAVAQESRRMSLRRQFTVDVALGRLDGNRMRPGLSASVVVQREKRPGVLLVPRAAVDFTGRIPHAQTPSGAKDVQLGPCNAQECVVVRGLKEGAAVQRLLEVNRG